jgi:hypothetical protein
MELVATQREYPFDCQRTTFFDSLRKIHRLTQPVDSDYAIAKAGIQPSLLLKSAATPFMMLLMMFFM